MKLSGLVLDIFDDNGDILRSIYPTREAIPGSIKTAHILSSDERDHLPDDVFALVMVNEDQKFRKFACVDEGNTRLSVGFFLKTAEKLPTEVQKIAASNLLTACAWYGIDPPQELQKVAGILDGGMKALNAAGQVMSVHSTYKDMQNTREATRHAQEETGSPLVTLDEIRAFKKQGEASGSSVMPQTDADLTTPEKSKAVIKKAEKDVPPDTVTPPMKEQPDKLPQAKVMKPVVDMTGVSPPVKHCEKKASVYALGDQYPLDSYEQVKTASAYFDEFSCRFTPADRHTYCVNLVKRAEALNIPVSDLVHKYGSETYAPEDEIKVAFASRRDLIANDTLRHVLDALEKQAGQIDPEVFCHALVEFDKTAGLAHLWDGHVVDPYWSTFGFQKEAEFSEILGNDRVTAKDLINMANDTSSLLRANFSADMAEEFKKDPVGVYKSLPVTQRKMLARMTGNYRNQGLTDA